MNRPSEVRRMEKEERKNNRPPLSSHLFGMLPFALSMYIKKEKKNDQVGQLK
ncbi:YqzE family protein [Bacillus sp. JCM 19034]|uniref:YqzE family protein n=1 Tax=Bacillus sp. JCM 19034 TaxID=1481928 RepID=UPI000AA64FAA|nr:YqzE family protein [Bacillus sp. JCM 19034]